MQTNHQALVPIVPGRGLLTTHSTRLRLDHLRKLSINTGELERTNLELYGIQKNIESYIGTVEVPVGLVGPLLFKDNGAEEMVYCAVGTLEGALVASMNRGARAISLSEGVSATFEWQKMVRVPMFVFANEGEASLFSQFSVRSFNQIKKVAEKFSNHATLHQIIPQQTGCAVHLRFEYSTGDASGQNMTTTCTWHAMLFIADKFAADTGITCNDFIIDGNGSSDKKVSRNSIENGRGCRVTAQCVLDERTINNILRTTPEKLVMMFEPSKEISKLNGMVGYNINVANAIAAIFVATGQDLGTLAESSTGFLSLERVATGVRFSLTLPNLLIGTVGGGTHLPAQNQALQMMGCNGSGKIERFAKLIACFALGLDISTYSSVVSGEFAKAHEKLGRNKPVDWLLRSELTSQFVARCLNGYMTGKRIVNVTFCDDELLENGILTSVAAKINKKLIGFVPFELMYHQNGCEEEVSLKMLIKSKALDRDVIKGLHMIAATVDPSLSDRIRETGDVLEYHNCHIKEIEVTQWLKSFDFEFMPVIYGRFVQPEREIFLFIQELLEPKNVKIINSEMSPGLWAEADVLNCISAITNVHQRSVWPTDAQALPHVTQFSAVPARSLYDSLAGVLIREETDLLKKEMLLRIPSLINDITDHHCRDVFTCLIHNDFNSRNVAIRSDNRPVIYDWELAVFNYPHRDIVEFLAFTLDSDFTPETLLKYISYHINLYDAAAVGNLAVWKKTYIYSLKELICTRLTFYEIAGIVLKYDFSERVLKNAFKMLDILESEFND